MYSENPFSYRGFLTIGGICHQFLTAGTPTILRMQCQLRFFTACGCSQPPAVRGTAVQPYSIECSCFTVPWEGHYTGEKSKAQVPEVRPPPIIVLVLIL